MLVADDEPNVLAAVRAFLMDRGHLVEVATSAPVALAWLRAEEFDVVMVDLHMPGGGLSVIEHLSGNPRFHGRIVLMSGALPADATVRVDPEVVWLQKPFRLRELAPLLEGTAQA
jgi:CheY-like chemotaxis protein